MVENREIFIPRRRWPRRNFVKTFDADNNRMIGLPYGEKNYDDMLSRFHLIPERHGRTNGQTDRRTDLLYQYRASVCWRAIKILLRFGWLQTFLAKLRLIANNFVWAVEPKLKMTANVNGVGVRAVVCFFDVTKPASICNHKKFRNYGLWSCLQCTLGQYM